MIQQEILYIEQVSTLQSKGRQDTQESASYIFMRPMESDLWFFTDFLLY